MGKSLFSKDLSWEVDGDYYHLIRYAIHDNGEIFIHFISKNRDKVWTDGEMMKLPDHASYHEDGTIHIRHKGGGKSKIPLKLKQSLLKTPGLVDFPFLTISYYKNRFGMYKQFLTRLKERPVGHDIVSVQESFTIIFYLKDLTGIPFQYREIRIEGKYGCMPIEGANIPKLENKQKASPIVNICFRPTRKIIAEMNTADVVISPEPQNP